MKKLVKQSRHGQITIPRAFRKALGLSRENLLAIRLIGAKLEIEPLTVVAKGAGSPWARELYELFAPSRRSLKDLSEDEINRAVDEAVKRVRGGPR